MCLRKQFNTLSTAGVSFIDIRHHRPTFYFIIIIASVGFLNGLDEGGIMAVSSCFVIQVKSIFDI